MKYLKIVALLFLLPLSTSFASDIEDEIKRHAETGNVNISMAAIHLRTGEVINVGGDQVLPLASTYKIPMAALALHMVEEGHLKHDTMIDVEPRDYVLWSPINDTFHHPGISLSLLNVMEAMMIHSDNTATDVLFRTIGGEEHLSHFLEEKGIKNLSVNRNTADLIRDYMGMERPPHPNISFREQYLEMIAGTSVEEEVDEQMMYDGLLKDPRDQGSAIAMATLLKKIWSGEILNPVNTEVLQGIMKRCVTGAHRLSGNLPAHALPISHKTGSVGGTINDAGVMEMPNGDNVVIVVYTSGSATQDVSLNEKAIAEIARSVYDYFLYK